MKTKASHFDTNMGGMRLDGFRLVVFFHDTLEQLLINHFGASKKTLFDYQNGKYPKYYIDRFGDIDTN